MDEKLKKGLSSLTYGLYVVTVDDGETKCAMVASWVSQVSYNPPRIMVGIKKVRFIHNILMELSEVSKKDGDVHFGLMVVQKGRETDLKRIKAGDQKSLFSGDNVIAGRSGAPLFNDYLCAFELKLVETLDAGDHTLFIGEVEDVVITGDGPPSSTLDYKKVYIGDI
ncbi:MAG: flavin reductase [Deltaproteobacteria bacterium]|uniref:Flavin reductase n=1 Tax=Candidatus Zymogenus saltonus TaxID=2844893 RepID=A0A9D8PQY9_9DELT|nr:flavin reductase [Candidatus Zymogenus saltonus]